MANFVERPDQQVRPRGPQQQDYPAVRLPQFLLCGLLVWLALAASAPVDLWASSRLQTETTQLVTLEFRYYLPEAGEVYLVWGLDGWGVAPAEIQPVGTVVEFGIMHTPLKRVGYSFIGTILAPAGARLDYGFQTRETSDGTMIEWVWDGDYTVTAVRDNRIELDSKIRLDQARSPVQSPAAPSVTQEFRYHAPAAGQVYLVWGLDGWQLAPAALRPLGTVVEYGLMHTPMTQEGENFWSQLQVPAGAVVDYGFQTRVTQDSIGIEWVWDGDYQAIPTTDDVVAHTATESLSNAEELIIDFALGPYLLLGASLLFGFFFLLGRGLGYRAPAGLAYPATALVATNASLYLLLLLLRAHLLGFVWVSPQAAWSFLPTLVAASYSDLLYVVAFSATGLGCLWLLRSRPQTQRLFALACMLVAWLSLLIGLLNIEIIQLLGKPLNIRWLYYADFLTSAEAQNAIIANLSNSILLNALALSAVLFILARLFFTGLFLVTQGAANRLLVILVVLLLCGNVGLTWWYNQTQARAYAKVVNPIVAFVESVSASGARPSLFTMQLNPEDWAEFRRPREAPLAVRSGEPPMSSGVQNVVLVVLESVGAEYLDAYGGTYAVTPELNRYQEHSLLFENIYAHAPASNKSLFSLLSANFPWLSPISLTQANPAVVLPTLNSRLKEVGYRTAFLSAGDTKFQRGDEYLAHRQFDLIHDVDTLPCMRTKLDLAWAHSDGVDEQCLVDAFSKWQEAAPEQPFFAMLWTVGTHYPYFVMDEEVDYGVQDKTLNRYLNALRHSDQVVGQLLRTLEERSLLESTLVVVVGDHGEAFGRHGQIGHATYIYEENVHVPLLLINPRLFHGERNPVIGGHADVAPTILDLLGLPAPDRWQGQSLLRSGRSGRTYLFAPWSDVWFGYREGNFKYLFNATSNQLEIYDLLADPHETTNLMEQMASVTPTVHRRLAAWVQHQDQVMQALVAQPQSPLRSTDFRLSLFVGLGIVLTVGTTVMLRRAPVVRTGSPHWRRLIYLRDLLYTLVARDFKLRYKRSVLGVAWSLLNPFTQLLVFYFIFSRVLPLNIPNYAAFLSIGILVWNWFQLSLLVATGAIVDNAGLIRRPGFPSAILPVVTLTAQLIHFLVALPILLVFLNLSSLPLTVALMALPQVVALQFLFTLSLAYFFATIHVVFRDMQYLLGVFLMLGFYVSPIFYDIKSVPAEYQWLYRFNPLVDLLDAYRAILIHGEVPNLLPLLPIGLLALGLLWIGHTVFRRASYRFVEEI